ncbi:MAG TPA: zf-HC2 domain-containing protein [Vicinamibacteria bacterium]
MDWDESGGETPDASRLGPLVTCREFVAFLDDYLSGVLLEATRTAFHAHLAACPACVAYMKSYEATVRAGKVAFNSRPDSMPADVPDELVRAVLAACRRL